MTTVNFKASQNVVYKDQLDYDMTRQEYFNFFNQYHNYTFKDEAEKNDFMDTEFYKMNKDKFLSFSWVNHVLYETNAKSISYHIGLKSNDYFQKEAFGVATPKKGTKTKYVFKFDDERIRPVELVLKKFKNNVFFHNNVTYTLLD